MKLHKLAEGFSVEVIIDDHKTLDFTFHSDLCRTFVQYPGTDGSMEDYRQFVKDFHAAGTTAETATDLLALTTL